MSGTKVNDYSISDTNIETLMLTTDQIFKGKCQCTLTEMDTTTVPEIAAGSYVEVAGTLFKFDSDESISTTDPVTSSTVADGTVYVMIVPSTDTCTAAFTATAPTWSDSKQGWYGTGAYASYRYVGGCTKATSSYTGKIIFKNVKGSVPLFDFEQVLVLASAYTSNLAKGPSPTTKLDSLFSAKIIDTHSAYSSDCTFTAPIKGIYKVSALNTSVYYGSQSLMYTIAFKKNGTAIKIVSTCSYSSNAADVYGQVTDFIWVGQMDVNDTMEFYGCHWSISGAIMNISNLCIELIRPQ